MTKHQRYTRAGRRPAYLNLAASARHGHPVVHVLAARPTKGDGGAARRMTRLDGHIKPSNSRTVEPLSRRNRVLGERFSPLVCHLSADVVLTSGS